MVHYGLRFTRARVAHNAERWDKRFPRCLASGFRPDTDEHAWALLFASALSLNLTNLLMINRRARNPLIQNAAAYSVIAEVIRARIHDASLPPGTVLLEGPLAEIFLCNRSLVTDALTSLQEEGLLSRFEGRGRIVGSRDATPRRVTLTRKMLAVDERDIGVKRIPAWQKIYHIIERDLIYRSVLGQFRINEYELARHCHFGRTVAKDVLTQLQATGIIAKDSRAQWFTVPLDAKRIGDLYALRAQLEPTLVANASLPITALLVMKERLIQAAADYPNVSAAALDRLETDVHVSLLAHGNNPEMLEALKRTRCLLISGKHLLGAAAPYPKTEPFFQEHLGIIQALIDGDSTLAQLEMRRHLQLSKKKVTARLEAIRTRRVITPLSYVEKY